MLYESLSHLEDPSVRNQLDSRIYECLKRAKSGEFDELSEGKYDIDGENLFFFRNDFISALPEQKQYEAHLAYADVHLVLEGQERIDLCFAERMGEWDFPQDKDIAFLDGQAQATVQLSAGDFLICYPQDAHKPGLAVDDSPALVKKITFKVRV